ncbi:type II toxin-antitoxin system HicB family antitoxin [Desulfovirgula thermocuniculi]|uniref:type II toxin-antitoxin system HicB family antitoxin n=1 Tax=Desulfovirgula thermocuniculi TaxID=348842 RepID=UPI0004809A57|nr:type II toxin-antitoxin system HicB family antitoxin [Desulfovirgula thermocuniculi]
MKFLVTLTQGEDGYIIAECPALPGCMSQGRTREEALANIKEAIALSLETRKELGLPLYHEVAEVEVAV